MKRIVLLMLAMMLSSGCDLKGQNNKQSIHEGEGYILELAEDRILVVVNKYLSKTWKDIMNDYVGEAIWLRTNTKNLTVGQKIYYKIKDGIDESYPSQADAKEIKVLRE
ncbi:DUF3221 domain-containing protein [Paenibacillus timonensis]|uniref:DUF3221 domain-containing protein n=1 Tax=Paenibacillus timonensis TaxID=225915 RepID=UPI003F9B4239